MDNVITIRETEKEKCLVSGYPIGSPFCVKLCEFCNGTTFNAVADEKSLLKIKCSKKNEALGIKEEPKQEHFVDPVKNRPQEWIDQNRELFEGMHILEIKVIQNKITMLNHIGIDNWTPEERIEHMRLMERKTNLEYLIGE